MLDSIVLLANKVPLYVQLREQLLSAIGSGLLKPGQQMPTVREVSSTLRMNPGTVQQAYAELERDGVIVVQRGRGTFVVDAPPPLDSVLRAVRLDEFVHKMIASARAQGFARSEIFERAAEIDPTF